MLGVGRGVMPPGKQWSVTAFMKHTCIMILRTWVEVKRLGVRCELYQVQSVVDTEWM